MWASNVVPAEILWGLRGVFRFFLAKSLVIPAVYMKFKLKLVSIKLEFHTYGWNYPWFSQKIRKGSPDDFRRDNIAGSHGIKENFSYCPDCPNGSKLQILYMNLAVNLYTIYLGALLTQQIDSKMGQTYKETYTIPLRLLCHHVHGLLWHWFLSFHRGGGRSINLLMHAHILKKFF